MDKKAWKKVNDYFRDLAGKKLDLNGILFLIGVQELGQGVRPFSKEEKQDLMHIAICKVLSYGGFYELEGIDQEGWPHWKGTEKLPFLELKAQEEVLKTHIIMYFEKEIV